VRKLLLLVVFMTALSVNAQSIKLGIKGGLDLTDMTLSKDDFSSSNRTGFFIGPTVKLSTGTGLGFDISGLYNHRSFKVDGVDGHEGTTLKQNQFIVPVNVRYGFGLGSLASIFVFAGPQFGFNLGSKNTNYDETQETISQWRLRDANYSVNVGAGVLLGSIQVSANYNVGLGKAGEATFSNSIDAAFKGSKKNCNAKSFQVALTYYF
jgi:hypothetical protein